MQGESKLNKEINTFIADKGMDTPEFCQYASDLTVAKYQELCKPHAEDRDQFTFGLSSAGGCIRAAQLRIMGVPVTHSAGTLFTFRIGHVLEPLGLALLRGIGFKVIEPQAEVKIWGDNDVALFHSWTDGIVWRADYGEVALSVKTMGLKNSGFYRGKATRRGFTALPFEGVKPGWFVQSELEGYGLKLDRSLVLVMAKEFIQAFETEDEWMQKSGSAVIWTDVLDTNYRWVETIVLPEFQRAQNELLAGKIGCGKQYESDSGTWVEIDPRTKNAVNGWNFCKWSTGSCDMFDECKKRLEEK